MVPWGVVNGVQLVYSNFSPGLITGWCPTTARPRTSWTSPVASVMTTTPRMAHDHELGSAVVHRMETHGIMAMPVLNEQEHLVGIVHLHDLMRAGAS